MNINTLYLLIAFVFGAVVGSFLNVVIYRLPNKGESVAFPPSHCTSCDTGLHWYENIPVLSYLALRGKCHHCKATISIQYPVVEMSMALLSMALMYKFGPAIETFGYFLFSAALLVIIWIDARHQLIPDVISLSGIMLGFLFSIVNPDLSWQFSLVGILVGGGSFYCIAFCYSFIRQIDGLGGGDIKFVAMIGAFLGWQALPFVVFISSIGGIVAGQRLTPIPFGPFLAVSSLLYLFWL